MNESSTQRLSDQHFLAFLDEPSEDDSLSDVGCDTPWLHYDDDRQLLEDGQSSTLKIGTSDSRVRASQATSSFNSGRRSCLTMDLDTTSITVPSKPVISLQNNVTYFSNVAPMNQSDECEEKKEEHNQDDPIPYPIKFPLNWHSHAASSPLFRQIQVDPYTAHHEFYADEYWDRYHRRLKYLQGFSNQVRRESEKLMKQAKEADSDWCSEDEIEFKARTVRKLIDQRKKMRVTPSSLVFSDDDSHHSDSASDVGSIGQYTDEDRSIYGFHYSSESSSNDDSSEDQSSDENSESEDSGSSLSSGIRMYTDDESEDNESDSDSNSDDSDFIGLARDASTQAYFQKQHLSRPMTDDHTLSEDHPMYGVRSSSGSSSSGMGDHSSTSVLFDPKSGTFIRAGRMKNIGEMAAEDDNQEAIELMNMLQELHKQRKAHLQLSHAHAKSLMDSKQAQLSQFKRKSLRFDPEFKAMLRPKSMADSYRYSRSHRTRKESLSSLDSCVLVDEPGAYEAEQRALKQSPFARFGSTSEMAEMFAHSLGTDHKSKSGIDISEYELDLPKAGKSSITSLIHKSSDGLQSEVMVLRRVLGDGSVKSISESLIEGIILRKEVRIPRRVDRPLSFYSEDTSDTSRHRSNSDIHTVTRFVSGSDLSRMSRSREMTESMRRGIELSTMDSWDYSSELMMDHRPLTSEDFIQRAADIANGRLDSTDFYSAAGFGSTAVRTRKRLF